ncbi:Ig-like domain-containing protein [Pelagibacterium halotolerans]|uniref:Ig-like domain-containing protein n=1 Tax=Pelagibacterium halotolerans TaxID=531813 RepID=UPI00384E2723
MPVAPLWVSSDVTIGENRPEAPVGLHLDPASDAVWCNSDGITSDNTPTLTGAAGSTEAGATVMVYDANGTTVLGAGVAASDGSWSVTTNVLSDETHDLTVKAADVAGNLSVAGDAVTIV